jgi:hypothetical protein
MRALRLCIPVAIAFLSLAATAERSDEPEGVEKQGDTVRAKPGYELVMTVRDRGVSRRKPSRSGGKASTTGEFICVCDKGEGSCKGELGPGKDTIRCVPVTQCEKCGILLRVVKITF